MNNEAIRRLSVSEMFDANEMATEEFWREIGRMSKVEVALLLHHTQLERDQAVERLAAHLRSSASKPCSA